MASLPESARAVLQSPALAHLVTLNPDGSPQVTVVWVGLDGDEIVAAHLPEHRKVRNIRNDSRVAQASCPDNENIIMVMRKHSCRINPVLNVAFISDRKILANYETVGVHSWYGRVFADRKPVVSRQ